MVADLTLRWIVTVLFVAGAAASVYAVVVGRRTPRIVVGQGLHVVMSVAMVVMAWPQGAGLPTAAPMVFFLLATAWFVAAAVMDPDHWASSVYHAVMMLAMAWMYAVMNGRILPGQADGDSSGGHHHHGPVATDMPAMDHGSVGTMPAMDHGSVGTPPYIEVVNWFAAVGFGLAAVWWLYRYIVRRRSLPMAPADSCLGELGQALMAAGMSIMFVVMI